MIRTSQHTNALRQVHHRIHLIASVLESRYSFSERNQQRRTLCSMLFGQRHTSHMNINLHHHHLSKSPATTTSPCHIVLCSLFEMLSAQFLSSCPNAASLVTITRNSTNTHTYCGTRGAKFHLSHVVVGKCSLVLHVQYASFLPFQGSSAEPWHLVFLEHLLL